MDVPLFSNTRGRQGVTLLVIRPHPDDASIATGALLASDCARSVRTGVVICTGGEEGAILASDLDPTAERPRLRDPDTCGRPSLCVMSRGAEERPQSLCSLDTDTGSFYIEREPPLLATSQERRTRGWMWH